MNIISIMRCALITANMLVYTMTSCAEHPNPERALNDAFLNPRTILFKPFIYYIQQGNLTATKHYAKSNIFSQFINWKDEEGRTPLWHAVDSGHDYIVKFLLENKADSSIADNKNITPLQLAQDKKLQDIIALLQPQK